MELTQEIKEAILNGASAMTRDGDYILQDCDGSALSFLCVFNEDIEWSIGK